MTRKSLAFLLAALLLAVTAAGCGKNADPAAGSDTPSAGTEQTGQETAAPEKVDLGPIAVGEEVQFGSLKVTLDQAELVRGASGIPSGFAALVIKLTIKNEGEEPYTINVTDHYTVTTPEGKSARYNIMAAGQRNPRLQGTVTSGNSTSGWLGYMVKEQAGTYTLNMSLADIGSVTWEFEVQ